MAIEGTITWRYTMEGVCPPGVLAEQIEAVVRSNVSWGDPILGVLRGSTITLEELTPEELARRQGPKLV